MSAYCTITATSHSGLAGQHGMLTTGVSMPLSDRNFCTPIDAASLGRAAIHPPSQAQEPSAITALAFSAVSARESMPFSPPTISTLPSYAVGTAPSYTSTYPPASMVSLRACSMV